MLAVMGMMAVVGGVAIVGVVANHIQQISIVVADLPNFEGVWYNR